MLMAVDNCTGAVGRFVVELGWQPERLYFSGLSTSRHNYSGIRSMDDDHEHNIMKYNTNNTCNTYINTYINEFRWTKPVAEVAL